MRTEEQNILATLTIRNVDPQLKENLRIRAAYNGHSMEAELRHILRAALVQDVASSNTGLATSIHSRMASLGGVELPDLPDDEMRKPPRFE